MSGDAKPSEPSKPTKKERSAKQKESLEKANKIRAEKLKIWKAEKAKADAEGKDYTTWNKKADEKKKKRTEDDALYDTILKAIEEREEKKKEEEARKAEKRKKPIKNKTLKNRNNYRINQIEQTPQIKQLPINNKTINSYKNDDDSEDSYSSDSDSSESTDLKVKEELWKQTQQEIGEVFIKNKIVNDFIKQQKTLEPEYKPLPPPPAPAPTPTPTPPTKQDLELLKQEIIKQHQIRQQQERQEIIRRQEEQKQQIKQIPHPKQENTTIGLITNTKINQKAVLEPPKYNTNIDTIYNPQTLNTLPIYKDSNIIRDTKQPAPAPAPAPQPFILDGNHFRENQLRQMMGLKQIERPRYEPYKPEPSIKYTTGSPILDRLVNN